MIDYDFLVTEQPWRNAAECRGADPALFYLEKHDPRTNVKVAKVRLMCNRCTVRDECLEWALTGGPEGHGEPFGMWAGTTPLERKKLRVGGRARAEVLKHGTASGYAWHRREGTDPCDECRTARRTADRARTARHRQRAERKNDAAA